MAQIDRLLAAVVSQQGDGLRLAGDDAVHLIGAGGPRPLTRQALSAQQVLGLLREIAPPDAAREIEAGRAVSFRYVTAEGSFVADLRVEDGRWSASLTLDGRGDVRRITGDHAAVQPAPAVSVGSSAAREAAARDAVERLLRTLVEMKGSDLHLRCGEPPIVRKDGQLVRLEARPLEDAELEAMLLSIMPDRNRAEFVCSVANVK